MDKFNKNAGWKILQIIPASIGWKAVHCQQSENGQVDIFNRTILCWAIVEPIGGTDGARTQVRGIEQELDCLTVVGDLINTEEIAEEGIDRNQYFLGYDDPEAHKESAYWIKQANSRLKTEKEKRTGKRT